MLFLQLATNEQAMCELYKWHVPYNQQLPIWEGFTHTGETMVSFYPSK